MGPAFGRSHHFNSRLVSLRNNNGRHGRRSAAAAEATSPATPATTATAEAAAGRRAQLRGQTFLNADLILHDTVRHAHGSIFGRTEV